MKRILIALLFLPSLLIAQSWVKNVPKSKSENVSVFDLQTSFNEYYNEQRVVNGKRNINGELHKVPTWKQFKRWEWYWESRVEPNAGLFAGAKNINKYYSQAKVQSKSKLDGNWKSMGPSSSNGGYAGIGRINCIAFHPSNNNVFWVGSPSGGLWKTNDAGATWEVLTDNNAVLGVSDIVIPSDYENSKTIYIATGDRDGGSVWSLMGIYSNDNNSIGVLKSTDDGKTWQTTGLSYEVSQNKQIGRLLIHPTNNKILYAGTSDGISKSVDSGASWTSVYAGSYVVDMEFKPGNPDVMYASTMDYYDKVKVLKSTNTGASWTTLKEFNMTDYRIEMAVTAHDPDYLYLLIANQDGGLSAIYRSINSGSAFSELANGSNSGEAMLGYYSDGLGSNEGQGGYDLCIAASPTNKNFVLVGGVNTWKTTNGGIGWEICNMWTTWDQYNKDNAPEVHADKHALVFRSNGDLFEANDGGIYISENNGDSWTDLTNNMVISQIYRLGVSQTNANMVINGLQDNGSKLYNSPNWSDVTGGDGMECIIDYTEENTQYATYVNGEIYRTTDKWKFDQTTISDNISNDEGAWVTPYVMDFNNNSILYVGYSDVWKTTNKGNSFVKISDINTSEKIRSMAIAPSNSDVLIVADFGHVWKTENGGTSWSEITNNLPVATNAITYISIKADDPQTIWVSMSAYNGKGVFESTNGGESWNDISTGLPELPVLCVIQNKQVSAVNQLYVATDRGVYLKHGNNNWINFSEGLPNVVVTEIEIYYNTDVAKSMLRAATYGRGLWESTLYGLPPVADFTVSESNLVQTDVVEFSDLSVNGAHTWEWSFEGGKPQTSTDESPKVTYDTVGVFKVSLIATNDFGSDTVVKNDFITVGELLKPIAAFSTDKTKAFVNENITFTDESLYNPTAWEWTFEGGNPATSIEENPSVSYSLEGEYDVSLKVTNSIGDSTLTKTDFITIETPQAPVAGFKANSNSVFEGQSVTFTDTSLNIPDEWQWTFEGGTPETSSLQNPTISYNDVGNYNVSLVALNKTGKDSVGKGAYVEVKQIVQAEADFSASPQTGSIPLVVTFLNNSVNANSYEWNFGDGGSSTDENPTYEYSTVGEYNVTLKASNENNSDSETKIGYIDVISAEPVASFIAEPQSGVAPLEVTFVNNSQSASTYSWDFGDGGTSIEEVPTYTYETPGDYTVQLVVSNSLGSDTQTKTNYIEVNYPEPVAAFEASPLTGTAPLTVSFNNLSEDAHSWTWDFGDNSEIKHDEYPTHVYGKGTFNVSLLVTNPSGNDYLVKENYISVDPNSLPEPLQDKLLVYPNPVSDVLNVSFNNENSKKVSVELFNAQGKLLYANNYKEKLLVKEEIEMYDLEAGTYLLRINVETHIVVLSVIKE